MGFTLQKNFHIDALLPRYIQGNVNYRSEDEVFCIAMEIILIFVYNDQYFLFVLVEYAT